MVLGLEEFIGGTRLVELDVIEHFETKLRCRLRIGALPQFDKRPHALMDIPKGLAGGAM
ncbi:hypothetical protein MDOR_35210 [Mycolicibacterium doricum]|uniref:Uncharacterized protein n=1 Tax=Mycolicibacterium doricum TaxID=126673 RepID=A0A7I7VXI4_9MYCO|nr:hypothetical protein MDOR_35210 [Mycolicibacterium doricum]